MKKLISIFLALIFVFTLILPAAAADSASGATLRLEKTEGTVTITKSSGSDVSVKENMRLLSGYTIKTAAASYAYISLDDTKAVKLDASSEVSIDKSGKKLDINLVSGALFFDVSKPLDGDEQLNIKTSTMITGVRGTSGVVRVKPLRLLRSTQLSLFDGAVWTTSFFASGEKREALVEAGNAMESSSPYPYEITVEDIPGFAAVEIAADSELQERVAGTFGEEATQEIVAGAEERLAADEAEAAEEAKELETTLAGQKDEQKEIDEKAGVSESGAKDDIQLFEDTEPTAPAPVSYGGGGDPGGGTSEPPSTTLTVMSADEFVAALELAEDNPSTSYTITVAATSPINGSDIEAAIINANSARESAGKSPMSPDISIKSNTTVVSNENFQPDMLTLMGGTLSGTLNYETNLTIDNGTIGSGANISVNSTSVSSEATVSGNLAGYENSQNNQNNPPCIITVENGAALTNSGVVKAKLVLEDGSTVTNTGTITLPGDGSGIDMASGSTLNHNGGTITANNSPINVSEGATLNVAGGNIRCTDRTYSPVYAYGNCIVSSGSIITEEAVAAVELSNNGKVTLSGTGKLESTAGGSAILSSGGTIEITGGSALASSNHALNTRNTTINISGGIVSSEYVTMSSNGDEITISGGNISSSGTEALNGQAIKASGSIVTVSGGNISSEHSNAISASGTELGISGNAQISTSSGHTISLQGSSPLTMSGGAVNYTGSDAYSAIYCHEADSSIELTENALVTSSTGLAPTIDVQYSSITVNITGEGRGVTNSGSGADSCAIKATEVSGFILRSGEIISDNSSAIVLSSSTLTVGDWNNGDPTGSADIQAAQNGIWINDKNAQTSGSTVTLYAGKISTSSTNLEEDFYALKGENFRLGTDEEARIVAEKEKVQLGGIFTSLDEDTNLYASAAFFNPYALKKVEGTTNYWAIYIGA